MVSVRSAAPGSEWAAVLLAATVVLGASLLVGRARADAFSAAVVAQPWEESFTRLPAPEQLRYRLLREAMLEAESLRLSSGSWPSPEQLAAELLPGFSPDPVDGAPLKWSLRQDGPVVHYLGVPEEGQRRARWLLVFIEPEPNPLRTGGEPAPVADEEHHLWPNGLVLHAQVWTQDARGEAPERIFTAPQHEGWTQRRGAEVSP